MNIDPHVGVISVIDSCEKNPCAAGTAYSSVKAQRYTYLLLSGECSRDTKLPEMFSRPLVRRIVAPYLLPPPPASTETLEPVSVDDAGTGTSFKAHSSAFACLVCSIMLFRDQITLRDGDAYHTGTARHSCTGVASSFSVPL